MDAKRKKWVKRISLFTAGFLVLGAGVTVYLLSRAPAVWREAEEVLHSTTGNAREQITGNVVQRLSTLVNAQDPSSVGMVSPYGELPGIGVISPYSLKQGPVASDLSDQPLDRIVEMTLTNAELLLLVNEMFVQWSLDRGYIIPGGLTDPVVLARDGKLKVAFMIDTRHWQQVFSGDISLSFSPDGMAHGHVGHLYAGSLPVSVISVAQTLHAELPKEDADRLSSWLENLEGFHFRPVLEIEHRRRARVLSMAVGDREVTLKLRVQDHLTYKMHNSLLGQGKVAVTDALNLTNWDGSAFADVPTTTD